MADNCIEPRKPVRKRRQLLSPEQRADHDQKILDDFNRHFPVGTKVWYYRTLPFGPREETTVRSAAWMLGSGEPVCKIAGFAGGVSIWHIFPNK